MIYEKEMFHYLLLHFPIALFVTGYIFDCLLIFNNNNFNNFSLWNIGMGLFWGILTIITGFITDNSLYGHMESPFPIWTTHGTHMIIAILLFLIFFVLKYLKLKNRLFISRNILFIIHTLILLFFIHGTHIGAKLADRL